MSQQRRKPLGKIPTNIPGLDSILAGGFPELSINIITGSPGAGKTIFSQQLIYTNATPTQKALYLTTLSEPPIKMLYYLQQFDFFDRDKVGEQVIYLDIGEVIRDRGLEETLNAILNYVQQYKPAIVGIDSFKAINDMVQDPVQARKFGYDLSVRLTTWAVTTLLVGEYTEDEIEQQPIFAIADSIIRMQYQPLGLHYQRYINVLKLRGCDYFSGMHPFKINNAGLRVYPRIKLSITAPPASLQTGRVSTGIIGLDQMLAGGFPAGSATMVAGGAGTGKTLLGLNFITTGIKENEPGVIVSFQENPQQLQQIADSFNWNLLRLAAEDQLIHLYHSPVEIQPDIHAAYILDAVEKIGAKRVLLDSIKDIEIATPDKVRYKDYIYALVNQLKLQGITIIMNHEIPELFGDFQVSEYGVSFIADNVILLRYVELSGEMGRAINIMKMRGSQHSKEIRRFEINDTGLLIGDMMTAQTGILTGLPILTAIPHSTINDLPARSQYILKTLQQKGTSTVAELATQTGLPESDVEQEMEELQDQGLILSLNRNNLKYYRVTI
ncbi:MAG: ATPase domain-containing protein [Coleofasciculus sp. C2-GNP5-27]